MPGDSLLESGDSLIEPGENLLEPGDSFLGPGAASLSLGTTSFEPGAASLSLETASLSSSDPEGGVPVSGHNVNIFETLAALNFFNETNRKLGTSLRRVQTIPSRLR